MQAEFFTGTGTATHDPAPLGRSASDMVRHMIHYGLDPLELAGRCGVHERTVFNWARRGPKHTDPRERDAKVIRAMYDRFERGAPILNGNGESVA